MKKKQFLRVIMLYKDVCTTRDCIVMDCSALLYFSVGTCFDYIKQLKRSWQKPFFFFLVRPRGNNPTTPKWVFVVKLYVPKNRV